MFVKGLILCCVIALTQAMFLPHPPKFVKKFPIKPFVHKKFIPIIRKIPIKVPHTVYVEKKVEVPVYIDRPVPYPVEAGAVAGAGAIAGASAGAVAGAGAGIDIAAKINDADHVNINVDGSLVNNLGAGAVAGASGGAAAGAVADAGFENFNDFGNNGFENYDMGLIDGQQDLFGGDFTGSQIPAQLPAQGHVQLPAPKHEGPKGQAGHGGHFPEIAHAQDIVHF